MNAGASVSYFAMVEIALLTGLAFLLSCMLLRELAFSFGNGTISHIIGEGMLIIGWVYTNGSRSDALRILAKLSKTPVNVQPKP